MLKWGGKLTTAPRVAWEIAHGPLPPSARVQRCPDDPLCVLVEHLSLFAVEPNDDGAPRSARGGGSKREISSRVWQLTVTSGADDKGVARRAYRTIHGTEKDATRALAAFVAEVEDGETVAVAANSSKSMTVTDLVEWYLEFARNDRRLDHSTLVGYRDVFGLWLKGHSATSGRRS